MSTEKNKTRIGLRPFSEMIPELATGDFDREVTIELAKLVQAVEATGQKGKLIIELSLSPGPKTITLATNIKVTIPRPALEVTSLFSDDKGGLHVENPRQTKMFDGPRVVGGNEPPKNDGEN